MAYAHAPHAQVTTSLPHKTGRWRPWIIAAGSLLAVMIALGIIGAVYPSTPANCPKGCPHPPPASSPPLPIQHRYTSSTYGYSLEYSDDVSPTTQDGSSIGWAYTLKSDGAPLTWRFVGQNANGRSAQQVVDDLLRNSDYSDASHVYDIPGAELGYTPGFGSVYDTTLTPADGQRLNGRLIIMAAVKRDKQGREIAVGLVAVGPFRHTTPARDGHPNPAETPVVDEFDPIANSVTWAGEPPL